MLIRDLDVRLLGGADFALEVRVVLASLLELCLLPIKIRQQLRIVVVLNLRHLLLGE